MINIYENEMPMPVKNDGKIPVRRYTEIMWEMKIGEEVTEVEEAGSIEEKAEEIADVITVCTSWLEALGFDAEDRKRLYRKVNKKNHIRGYMDQMPHAGEGENMKKNRMTEIMAMLGVEPGERFMVEKQGQKIECIFYKYGINIVDQCYVDDFVDYGPYILNDLITGDAVIIDWPAVP